MATARAGNVIGGGDWSEDRLLPDLIRGFVAGQSTLIRNPGAIRPWQHVLEPVAGYIMLAQRLLGGEVAFADAWNFGPWDDDAWPVERIANEMVKGWGQGASWTKDQAVHVHEANYLKLDSSKARSRLKWQPRLRLHTALEWLVDWYKAWHSGAQMHEFTVGQIEQYASLLQADSQSSK